MPNSGDKLAARAERILCAVIDSYMQQALPVGSKRLGQDYQLPWSSATIRNEMAAMERQGYLTHAHTSSGRIPTANGMNYYVRYLLESAEIPEGLRRLISDEFEQVDTDPIHLNVTVSKILSRLSKNVSMMQSVGDGQSHFVVAGKEYFLGQPEFQDSLKLRDLFRVLEEEEVQTTIFRTAFRSQSVQVAIGSDSLDGPYKELFEDVSVVTSAIQARGRAFGAVGVIGTKRMDYRRMIPLVDYTAQSLGRKLAEA